MENRNLQMKKQYIVTFHTHYDALCCKRTLDEIIKPQDIAVEKDDVPQNAHSRLSCPKCTFKAKLIPVPRALSSSCGTALSVDVQSDTSEEQINNDVAFLFESEHDEIYTLLENGEYKLEAE